jgi:hypothetical protein
VNVAHFVHRASDVVLTDAGPRWSVLHFFFTLLGCQLSSVHFSALQGGPLTAPRWPPIFARNADDLGGTDGLTKLDPFTN